jgi:hypothetical protein
MMDMLEIQLLPPSVTGRLYPRHAARHRIMVLESPQIESCPHGINIDGLLILDANMDRVVNSVELLIPMRRWATADLPEWRPAAQEANLALASDTPHRSSFDVKLKVLSNATRTRGVIRIGEWQEGATDIALSEQCKVLLDGDNLRGFHFRFD